MLGKNIQENKKLCFRAEVDKPGYEPKNNLNLNLHKNPTHVVSSGVMAQMAKQKTQSRLHRCP